MPYATVTLRGTYRHLDGSTPASGTVLITPSVTHVIDAAGDVVLSGQVRVELDDTGSFSVQLPATDDDTLNPTGFGYTVQVQLAHAHLAPVRLELPASTPAVDMTDVTPLAAGSFLPSPTYSAYLVAQRAGFTGTEEEWLASLVGPQGDPGTPYDPSYMETLEGQALASSTAAGTSAADAASSATEAAGHADRAGQSAADAGGSANSAALSADAAAGQATAAETSATSSAAARDQAGTSEDNAAASATAAAGSATAAAGSADEAEGSATAAAGSATAAAGSASTASAAVTAHEAKADPHPQYLVEDGANYGADLNALVQPGRYFVPFGTATTGTNNTPSWSEGHVEVLRHISGGSTFLMQRYTTVSATVLGQTFYRTSANNGATWSSWHGLLRAADHNNSGDPHTQYARKDGATFSENASFQKAAIFRETPSNAARGYIIGHPGGMNSYQYDAAGTPYAVWDSRFSDKAFVFNVPKFIAVATDVTLGGVGYRTGTGSPEGVVAAPVGSRFVDTAATNGAVEWIKASGTGITGWRVVYGDTGWRLMPYATTGITGGQVFMKRSNDRVMVVSGTFPVAGAIPANPELLIAALATGWRPKEGSRALFGQNGSVPSKLMMSSANGIHLYGLTANQSIQIPEVSWHTSDPWPATLPGTAA